MSRRKIDAEELIRRILRCDEDLLRDDYPRHLVEAELRDAGLDPEDVGRRGEAFVKKLMADRAEAGSRKSSRTRLRSPVKATSPSPPAKATFSTLPPMRAKAPSDTGPLDDGE